MTRAKYYLAQVLKETHSSKLEIAQLEEEAKQSLSDLLRLDGSNTMKDYVEAEDYPILFDYIVSWELRLITPRKHMASEAAVV